MDSSAENVSLLPASTLGDDESAHSFLTRRKVVAGIALCAALAIAGVVGLQPKGEHLGSFLFYPFPLIIFNFRVASTCTYF